MRRAGITQLEVLVVASATGVLLFVAGGMGGAMRGGSQLAQCQARLRQIGQISGIVAGGDAKMIPHRQSTSGTSSWRGLGSWDWGGADGRCGEARSDWPNGSNLGAATRPYNLALFGSSIPPNADFSSFSCPSDVGAVLNPNFVPRYADLTPCTVDEADIIFASVFDAFGTSFAGDFLWWPGSYSAQSASLRFGSFERAGERFPKPNNTLLFYESRMAQAFLSTDEWINLGGAGSGGTPVTVPSWHAPSGFNSLFVDGHVENITINVSGSLVRPDSFDPTIYPYRQSIIRGTGWRYDAFPESFVYELGFGDTIPGSLVDGVGGRLNTRARFVPPVE